MSKPFSKQPSEKFFIRANFSKNWAAGDSVNLGSSTFTAVDKDGTDKSTDVLDQATLAAAADDKGLIIRVKDGLEAESPYKLTALCKTNLGDEWEKDIEMVVFDE
jgi:hypothetical protein